MTRRARRAVPSASPAEMAAWSKLAAAGQWTANHPEEHKVLVKARRRVRGAMMPRGQAVPGSPFDRLCRLADRWGSLLMTERQALAGELAAVVADCRAVLEALDAKADPAAPRERRDIDG